MSSVRRMMTQSAASSELLSPRQRLALTKGLVEPSAALTMNDSEIDVLFFKHKRVPVAQLRAAGLTPLDLKARGLESAMGLRELGFDALDLTDAGFCAAAVSAFGSDSVRQSFLIDAGDAVALAGSTASFQLEIGCRKLLEVCAGAPTQAKAVLQQSEPRGGALQGVSAAVVLDTGLRASTLCELGYFLDSVREQASATPEQLRSLGFV